jgi:transposase
MFEQRLPAGEIAGRLRVSTKSVRAWRRVWTAGGRAALASRGPGGAVCKLSDAQLDRLADELDRGPAASDWVGHQRWTLALSGSRTRPRPLISGFRPRVRTG